MHCSIITRSITGNIDGSIVGDRSIVGGRSIIESKSGIMLRVEVLLMHSGSRSIVDCGSIVESRTIVGAGALLVAKAALRSVPMQS